MQPPLPPVSAQAASPYQPPAAAMTKGNIYSFPKWLMIGYDLTSEKEADQYKDDVDGYATQIAVFGALAAILQTASLTLLAYAFVREAQEETGQHVAMRIALLLGAVVLLTSVVGRSFSLF